MRRWLRSGSQRACKSRARRVAQRPRPRRRTRARSAARRPRGDPSRRPRPDIHAARRALEPACAGAACPRRARGSARRTPRPNRPGGRRAPVRDEQARRGRRPVELASCTTRAEGNRRRRTSPRRPRRRGLRRRRRRPRPRTGGRRPRRHLRATPGRARPDRPRRTRRPGRHGAPDVHVRDHGRPEGRADDAAQPGCSGGVVDAVAVRPGHDQRDAVADVPRRRNRLGIPRALERCDDDPDT
jgi:hypothetical protein